MTMRTATRTRIGISTPLQLLLHVPKHFLKCRTSQQIRRIEDHRAMNTRTRRHMHDLLVVGLPPLSPQVDACPVIGATNNRKALRQDPQQQDDLTCQYVAASRPPRILQSEPAAAPTTSTNLRSSLRYQEHPEPKASKLFHA